MTTEGVIGSGESSAMSSSELKMFGCSGAEDGERSRLYACSSSRDWRYFLRSRYSGV